MNSQPEPLSTARRLVLGFELAVKTGLLVCALLLLALVVFPCVLVLLSAWWG